MPKTLLVDTNRAAVPVYRALLEWGHDVWVVGARESEPLARMAKHYVRLDYSDAGRLSSFVKEQGFDHVVPGCTDLSYKVVAEINEGRFPGIDTPEVTDSINTKSSFRRLASEIGITVPRVLTPEQALGMERVIVKPVDSFSGRGMEVLARPSPRKLADALAAAARVSKSGCALVEEFIEGQLFSHSAFVWEGEIVSDFIVQEDCTTSPFTVDTSRVRWEFSGRMQDSLRSDILRLSKSLGLVDGLVHTQFIVAGDRYWVIELTRRCPGDLYALLIEFSTGFPYAANYAAPFVARQPTSRPEPAAREWIIRHTATSKTGESLWGFQFSTSVDIRLFVPLATTGTYLDPSPYGRAGIFFFRSPTGEQQELLYQRLLAGNLYAMALK